MPRNQDKSEGLQQLKANVDRFRMEAFDWLTMLGQSSMLAHLSDLDHSIDQAIQREAEKKGERYASNSE